MHSAVHDMLSLYRCETVDHYREALKEIIQEIALLGLHRGGFFNRASFYGGTALRIFYGLDRFSEDLDFSLVEAEPGFEIAPYLNFINDELSAYGFIVEVNKKDKAHISDIESAFIKAGTRIHLVSIGLKKDLFPDLAEQEKLRVKIEIDINPPGNTEYEVKYNLNPVPYPVRLFKPPYLFAGKVHALLCRGWSGGRVKGRDLYDYLWFISRQVSLNLDYLAKRMVQTGHLESGAELDYNQILQLLSTRFSAIDYEQAKKDAFPFVTDPAKIESWSGQLFNSITVDRLKVEY